MRYVVVAQAQSEDLGKVVLAFRFCEHPSQASHMAELMLRQVRTRCPKFMGMRPAEARKLLEFDIYTAGGKSGWPVYHSNVGWWE